MRFCCISHGSQLSLFRKEPQCMLEIELLTSSLHYHNFLFHVVRNPKIGSPSLWQMQVVPPNNHPPLHKSLPALAHLLAASQVLQLQVVEYQTSTIPGQSA